MSSPKVLVFSEAPLEVARAGNEVQIATYLGLAQTVEDRVRERMAHLRMLGQTVPVLPYSVADLRAELLPLDPGADGSDALRRIFAVWHSLKDDYGIDIDRRYHESQSADDRERRALTERAAREFVQRVRTYHANVIVVRSSAEEAIENELLALARANGETLDALRRHVDSMIATTPAAQLAVALRVYRLSQEEAARTARIHVVAERLEREAAEDRRHDFEACAAMLHEQMRILDERTESRIRADLERLANDLATLAPDAFEARLAAVQRAVAEERRRVAMEGIVRKVLKQLGYSDVEMLQTITAKDIRERRAAVTYFRDPKDADRFVEVAFTEDNALSVEVVRADEDGDATERQRDAVAQKRLCDAMKMVGKSAAEAFDVTVLHDAEPGVAVGVRTRLRDVKRSNTTRPGADKEKVKYA